MATTGLDVTLANAILTALTPSASTTTVGTVTITAPIRVRLMTAIGASDSTFGTELSTGGSYVAGTGLSTASTWGTAASGSITNSSAAISQTNMPAGTIVSVELWDSSGTPKRSLWGALTSPKTTNSGDTLTFAVSSLTLSLS